MKQENKRINLEQVKDALMAARAKRSNKYPTEYWLLLQQAVAQYGLEAVSHTVGVRKDKIKYQLIDFARKQEPKNLNKLDNKDAKENQFLKVPMLNLPEKSSKGMKIRICMKSNQIYIKTESDCFDWNRLFSSLENLRSST